MDLFNNCRKIMQYIIYPYIGLYIIHKIYKRTTVINKSYENQKNTFNSIVPNISN